MAKLSVNVNKVATIRNSRGGACRASLEAVRVCVAAGAPGITVHPRADARHITPTDVREIAALLAPEAARVEFNIEGDPRPDLLALVHEVKPDQCTLVPVKAGRDHEPGRLAARHAAWRPAVDRRARCSATASASACSSIRNRRRWSGRRRSARTASSCTPSRLNAASPSR